MAPSKKPKVDHDKLEQTQVINLTDELRGTVNYLNTQRSRLLLENERLKKVLTFRADEALKAKEEVRTLKERLTISESNKNWFKDRTDWYSRSLDDAAKDTTNLGITIAVLLPFAGYGLIESIQWIAHHVSISLV
jgi:hypothetical protein